MLENHDASHPNPPRSFTVNQLKSYLTEFLLRGVKFSKPSCNASEKFLHNHFLSSAFGQSESLPWSRLVNEALKGLVAPLN